MQEEQTRVVSEHEKSLKVENETLQGTVTDPIQESRIRQKTEKQETTGTRPVEGIANLSEAEKTRGAELLKT